MIRLRSPIPPAAATRRRGERWPDRGQGERGSVTLQIALLFPVMLLIILAAFQAGLYWYTQSAALAAAQEGVRVTAAKDGSVTAGIDRANAFLQRTSGTLVEHPQISGRRTTTTATITVRGPVLTLIPNLPLTVVATATLPSEEYTG